MILRKVRAGRLPAAAPGQPERPPALEAICLKAMARSPRTATPRPASWPTTSSTGWPTSRSRPTASRGGAAGPVGSASQALGRRLPPSCSTPASSGRCGPLRPVSIGRRPIRRPNIRARSPGGPQSRGPPEALRPRQSGPRAYRQPHPGLDLANPEVARAGLTSPRRRRRARVEDAVRPLPLGVRHAPPSTTSSPA